MDLKQRWVCLGALVASIWTFSWGSVAAAKPAGAPTYDVVQVWYRSSEGCPDGPHFLGLLQRLGRAARLAGAGDRVDFVVTLASADGVSNGRLERQNSERSVAIRDVSTPSCDEAASVLALSLDLALQPAAETTAAPPAAEAVDGASAARSSAWQVGAQGTVETGLAHAVLPGAALFVDVGSPEPAWGLRLSLRGATGTHVGIDTVHLELFAARAEGCWAWALSRLRIGPCAGFDAGVVFAQGAGENGRNDRGQWYGAAAHLRASWALGGIALEAQLGALAPLVRYRLSARAGGEVTGSAALGLQAALGLSFSL